MSFVLYGASDGVGLTGLLIWDWFWIDMLLCFEIPKSDLRQSLNFDNLYRYSFS